MNLSLDSVKELDYKKILKKFVTYYKMHNATSIVIIAGLLVGYSLLKVNSLNNTANSSTTDVTLLDDPEAAPLVLTKLKLNEETIERLNAIAADEDVTVDSRLPDNRNNPFDDNTNSQLPIPDPTPQPEQEAEQ